METATLLVGVITACVGWWVGHYLATTRDVGNKRRDQRISHLIAAFNNLNRLRSFSSSLSIDEVSQLLVDTANNIELFGNEPQIKMFRELAQSVSEQQGTMKNIHELINNLRDDLRSLLQLKVSIGGVSYFAISKGT